MAKIFSRCVIASLWFATQLATALPAAATELLNEDDAAKAPSIIDGCPIWQPEELKDAADGYPHMKTERFIFNIWQVFKGDENAGELAIGGIVFLPNLITHKINGSSARFTNASDADGTGKMAEIVGSDRGDTLNVKLAALPEFFARPGLGKIGKYPFTFTTGYGDDLVNLELDNDRTEIIIIHTGGQDTVNISGSTKKSSLVIRGVAFDGIAAEDIVQGKDRRVEQVKFVTGKGTITLQGKNLNGYKVKAETGGTFTLSEQGVITDSSGPAMPDDVTRPAITPPPAAEQPRLLQDRQSPSPVKGSPVAWQISAAYDVNRLNEELMEQIRRLANNPEKSSQTLESVLLAIEAKLGRRLHLHPPENLGISSLAPSQDPACPPGRLVLDKAGKYQPEIPAGCKSVLIKAWGAGGGGVPGSMSLTVNGVKQPNIGSASGSTGGFSAGILELNGEQLAMNVGGGGESATGVEGGKGGYNGGGKGGRGSTRPSSPAATDTFEQMGGGGGGGGATTVTLNQETVLVAGGGGGAGAQVDGFPGGGANAVKYLQDFFHWKVRPDQDIYAGIGRPGDAGKGGAAGKPLSSGGSPARHNKSAGPVVPCFDPPEDGRSLDGGNGGSSKELACGDIGGGGGGAGFGGGGGGNSGDRGAGGGGGGLAPKNGVTLWGGLARPANAEDPDYKNPHGLPGRDGLIVISWPAPDTAAFTSVLKETLFVARQKND